MTDLTKLRAELRATDAKGWNVFCGGKDLLALLDALDAAERERDYGLTAADVADEMIRSRIPNCFLLDPPDGGDVKTWESVERIIAAMYKAERERDEARRERDEARALASEAIDEVESWGNYAPDWTKEKWDFVATLDDLRGRLWKDRAP